MDTNDDDNLVDGMDWDDRPIQTYKGLGVLNRGFDPRLYSGDESHIVVWNDKTESHIWWDFVYPIAKTIAKSRCISVVDIDAQIKLDPDNIFPVVSIDCSQLTHNRLKSFVRRESGEPLLKLLLSEKKNFLLYFHSIHETREKLYGLTSSIIDKIASYVIFSGVRGKSNLSNNILNPSNSNRCKHIYFVSCDEIKTQ
jgi:hypothetical protein